MPTMPSFHELSKKLPAKLPARPAFTVPEPARHVLARAVRAGDRFADEVTEKLRHRGDAGDPVAARAAHALAWSSGLSRRLSAPLRDAVLLDPAPAGTEAAGTGGAGTEAASTEAAAAPDEALAEGAAADAADPEVVAAKPVGRKPAARTLAAAKQVAAKQAARPRARRKPADTAAG